jgi:hypothetical protein
MNFEELKSEELVWTFPPEEIEIAPEKIYLPFSLQASPEKEKEI